MNIPDLEPHCASWVVSRRSTGEVIGEFFNRSNVEKFNPTVVMIETAAAYLGRINRGRTPGLKMKATRADLLNALAFALPYLEHPDVNAISFALPVRNVAEMFRRILNDEVPPSGEEVSQ